MMMSWLSKRQISPYLAIAIFFMLVFGWLCQVTPQRVGDGGEYYALFFAWAETLRPWMTQESFNGYETFFLKSSVAGLNPRESLESAFPALHLGATSDFNHFWFYSFLAFLSSKLIFGFDLQHEPHKSYLLLHFMLLLITASISYRLFKMRGLAAFLIMTLTSPIVWYFDKVHTELFTYCMVLISIMLMRQDRFIPAAAALSMAATQNPSFAIIALFPFSYRFLGLRGLRFSATETLLTVGVALMVLMHPVYYFLRYGVPTPQLLAGGAELGGVADVHAGSGAGDRVRSQGGRVLLVRRAGGLWHPDGAGGGAAGGRSRAWARSRRAVIHSWRGRSGPFRGLRSQRCPSTPR